MKTFLLLLAFLIVSNDVLLAQISKTTRRVEKIEKKAHSRTSKDQLINIPNLLGKSPITHQEYPQNAVGSCPLNLDFENKNFLNWTCLSGSVSTGTPVMAVTTPKKGIHSLYNAATGENFLTTSAYHFKLDSLDTFATKNNKKVLTTYCPYTNNYAVKIGNASPYNAGPGYKATGLLYAVQIPPNENNFRLTYYYAVVFHQSSSFPHSVADQPIFQVATTDSVGNVVGNACNNFEVTTYNRDFGWQGCLTPDGADSIYFKYWTSSTTLLKGHAGETVYLQFFVSDCTQGAHFGYAYVDVASDCAKQIVLSEKYCEGSKSASVTLPTGYKGYFLWDSSFSHVIDSFPKFKAPAIPTHTFTPAPPDSSFYFADLIPFQSFGCRDTAQIVLISAPRPKVSPIYGDSSVCVGKQIQLYDSTKGTNATAASIGIWNSNSIGKTYINLSTTKGLIIGKSEGVARVKYTFTDAFYPGCSDSAFYNITVNPLPKLSKIIGDSVICEGQTIQFSDTLSGGVWKITDTSYGQIDTTGFFTSKKAGTVTARYTATNAWGCVDSVSKLITINAMPVHPVISGTTNICSGKTSQLTSNVGGTWSSSYDSIATINASGLVTGLQTGINSIKNLVITSKGCKDSTFAIITVNPLPILAPIVGDSIACATKGLQYTEATIGGTWKVIDITTGTIDATGFFTPIIAGFDTIRYTLTNSFGCTDSVSQSVRIVFKPVKPTITGANIICATHTSALSTDATSSIWYATNDSVASVNNSGLVTGLKAGTDTIRNVVPQGCKDSNYIVVTVNPLPVVKPITGKTSICLNTTAALKNDSLNGVWSSSNINVATVFAGVVNGIGYGNVIITYTVNNSFGCTDSVHHAMTVNLKPIVNPIMGSTSICFGKTTILTDNTTEGKWVSVDSFIAKIDTNGLVKGIKAGSTTIKYIVNNGAGCIDSAFTNFIVNPLPVISQIQGATAICTGSNTTLSNATVGGTWISTDNLVANLTGTTVNGTKAGTTIIRYIVTSTDGCVDSTFINFNVVDKPTIQPIKGDSILCVGVNTALTNATANGTWNIVDTSFAHISTSGIVTPSSKIGKTSVHYIVTVPPGCSDSVNYDIRITNFSISLVNSTVNPVLQTSPVTISTNGTSNAYSVMSWTPTLNFTNQTATTQSFNADTTMNVCVVSKAFDGGCISTVCDSIIVTPLTTTITIPNIMKISATHPLNASVYIKVNPPLKSLLFKIFNQWGEQVFSTTDVTKGWDGKVGGSVQPIGVYIYVLKAVTHDNLPIEKTGSITLIK